LFRTKTEAFQKKTKRGESVWGDDPHCWNLHLSEEKERERRKRKWQKMRMGNVSKKDRRKTKNSGFIWHIF